MKFPKLNLIAAWAFILLLSACQQTPEKSHPEEFTAYIAGFTTGFVSGEAAIVVDLATVPNFPIVEPGNELSQTIFAFDPPIKGVAYRNSETRFSFVPENDWPRDREIKVSFYLGKLLEVPDKLKIFNFSVKTLPLSFSVGEPRLTPGESAGDPTYLFEVLIRFSESIEKIESKSFSLKVGKKEIGFEIVGTDKPLEYKLISDKIPRLDVQRQLQFEWDGASMGSLSKGSIEVDIPSTGHFAVERVQIVNFPDQAVIIQFSDLISSAQSKSGLFSVEGKSFTIKTERNLVTLFPDERLSGSFELLVAAGLENSEGKKLKSDYRSQLNFDLPPPEVRFSGKGVIMVGNNNRKLPFQAIGLKAVDVQVVQIFADNMLQFLQSNTLEGSSNLKSTGRLIARKHLRLDADKGRNLNQWNNYSIDLDELIKDKEGSLFRVYLSFTKQDALVACEQEENQLDENTSRDGVTAKDMANWSGSSWYDPDYYYPPGFSWRERDNPCHNSYYYYERFVSRNVMASNLGLIAKNKDLASNEFVFYATNLETAKPVAGVQVQLYDYQQQIITSGITTSDGSFALKAELIKPFVAVASYQGQFAYVGMEGGSALSLNRFDVSGKQLQEGMKGYIYTERGVYRPGDTIHTAFMLQSMNADLPGNYPAVIEVYNARDQLVHRQTNNKPDKGLYVFRVPTKAEMPTGRWKIVVTAGASRFEHTVRVETIKPNRLKVNFEFGDSIIQTNERQRAVKLAVNWLHGSPAAGLETSVNMNFTQSKKKPKGYQHYTFEDPSRYWSDESILVHQGETNTQGFMDFALNIPNYMKGPGKLNVQFVARAMEKGGDFTTATHSMTFNPYARYVGLLSPEPSASGYLLTDTNQVFEIVMLTAKEKAVSSANLNVEVYKQDWSWWWSGEGGSGSYVSVQHDKLVHSEMLQIRNGKASFKWQLEYPQWGAYFVRVIDEEGGHSTGKIVYFDWPGWYSRDGRAAGGGASTISITSDKESYNSGETAIVSFPSAEGGQALISIEKGDKQLRSWWVPTSKDETSFSLPLESMFAPNIYVHVMVLQPHGQTLNDLPIRMYGLVMLPVTYKEAKLQPLISMPAELRPESTFNVKVSEQSGKAMSYTIAMVDEGLLDLTNFRTPDPYAYFYSREALGLKTWDMFDYVIGAYGGRIEQVFAIGGDEAIAARERARQSRFKPVVYFLGPFSLEKNAENQHQIAMPNYVGSVRLMVAATAGDAFGHAENTSAVKQPVMVLGTLPRVLRPGDELMLPVTVFSGFKSKQEITVQVEVSGNLLLEGEGKQQLIFDSEGEQMTYFGLKVPDKEGMASIRIDAFSGKEKAYYSQEIAVQNPNSRQYVTEKHILESGNRITLNNKLIGLPETRINLLEFSGMPVVNLDKRLQYLNTFPYGCTEQITSIGFAQLYLAQFSSSEDAVNRKTAQHIKSAIEKIVLRLQQDGAVRYWPGGSYINEFAAVYAGHFMVLASREGHPVPSYFLSQWNKDQKRKAAVWQPEVYANRLLNDVVQAYRLYALALAGEAQTAAMNRLRENPNLSTVAANMLGAAYAVVGQEAAARELIMGMKAYVNHNSHYQNTFGSELRDKAMRAEALIRIGENTEAFKLINELAVKLGNDSWLSTQETAYALYSVQLFMRQFPPQQKELSLELTEGNANPVEIQTTDNYGTISLKNESSRWQVENKGSEVLFINLLSSGIPLREDHTVVEDNLTLNINWQDMGGQAINPKNLKQGMAFEMVVRVRNTSDRTQNFLVLDQIVPSGWEIVNERLTGEGTQAADVDYVDIRDDRVTTFFTLLRGQEKVFRISLLAAYEGKFYLPPTVCSAMYDHNIQARKGGGEVEVKRE